MHMITFTEIGTTDLCIAFIYKVYIGNYHHIFTLCKTSSTQSRGGRNLITWLCTRNLQTLHPHPSELWDKKTHII